MMQSIFVVAFITFSLFEASTGFIPNFATSSSSSAATALPANHANARHGDHGAAGTGAVVELLDSNFASLFHADRPLLIDAYAPWCGPCKLIEPVIANCAKEWCDQLIVSRWNVEALQTDVKIELLLQGANPRKLPSLILVHNGQAKAIHGGLISDEQLAELLSEHLPMKTILAPTASTKQQAVAQDDNGKEDSTTRKAGFINFASEKADAYMLSVGR